jgi:MFS family permease
MLSAVSGVTRHLRDSASAFRDVFRNGNLRKLEIAWAFANIGHWAYVVAVNVYAFNAGGAGAVGFLMLIRMVPAALIAPFTATLADRYPRNAVMLASNLARAVLIGAAGICVLADAPAGVIYVLAAVAVLVGTPFRPALAAITPTAARTPAELTAANAVASTIESLGFFLGPAVAGLLLIAASTGVVFLITASAFVCSALLIGLLDLPAEAERARGVTRSNIFAETIVGFRTVVSDRRLAMIIGLFSAQTLVAGILVVLVVVMAIDLLDMGDSGVGYLNAAFGVGALIGSIFALSLAGLRRLSLPFVTGVLLWGLPLVLIGIWPEAALAIVLLAIVGAGNSLVDVAAFTLIQRAVPEQVLARVFGVIQMLWVLTVGLGAAIAVPLVDRLGAETALVVTGLFLPALLAVLGGPLLKIDAAATAPGPELSLLRSSPIFAPLPGTTLEHLAARLVPLRLEPGTVIVREGDPGDRFYLIVEGKVDVSAEGRALSQLGPGDYFGEIALIRDMPRTATVTASTAVVVHVLEREDFLAAVTGHAPSAVAAEQVVSSRLAGVPATGPLPGA